MVSDYTELIDKFIAFHVSLGHSNKTIQAYKNTLKEFFFDYLDEKQLDKLTIEDIHLFKKYKENKAIKRKNIGISGQGAGAFLKGEVVASSSMNRHLAAIRQFLIFNNYSNLAKEIRILKVQKIFDIIDFEDIKKIFENDFIEKYYQNKVKNKNSEKIAFYSDRLRLLLDFVVSTGLRLEEVFNLERENLKTDRKIPFVKVNGKGNKIREVELSSSWIQQYLLFLEKYPKTKNSNKIFTNYEGGALSYSTLRTYIKQLGYAADVPHLSFHKLRHCYAIMDYKIHRDIVKLSKALGHDSVQTTMIYLSKVSTKSGKSVDILTQFNEVS